MAQDNGSGFARLLGHDGIPCLGEGINYGGIPGLNFGAQGNGALKLGAPLRIQPGRSDDPKSLLG